MKQPNRVLWTAVLVAWCFDFLFWKKPPGVSFFIFILVSLIVGFYLAWKEDIQHGKRSLWLLVPILVFGIGTFTRREPFTTFVNILLVLVSMGVFAHTFVRGRWLKYSLSDFIAAFFYLLIGALLKPIEMLPRKRAGAGEEGGSSKGIQSRWKRSIPYLRGLLIALPVVAVFASLFSAADPIFAGYLQDFVDLFRLEKLPEYLFRGVYILFLGYLLSGVYFHAFTHKKEDVLIGEEKPWLPAFLGFTESTIVLGSVDVLFSLFVGIQFRYFFGGQANIRLDGFTYAEYARRGFGELVVVSIFSLLLFLGLSAVSQREDRTRQKTFSTMGILLFLLVVVILVSAFQRLLLYEQAYGFTRLRTYSHVFMVWLGVLLAAVVVLELIQKQRAFGIASFLVSIGFVFSLNLVNVDRLITEQNVQRAIVANSQGGNGQDGELDAYYLYSLSSDATPALIGAQQNPTLTEVNRNELAAILACQIAEIAELRQEQSWQSFHAADARAWQLLVEHREDFQAARVYQQHDAWWVMVNGDRRPCRYDLWGWD